MRKDKIYEGATIDTLTGSLKVKFYNGSIVDLDEYTIDDNDNLVKTGETRLTLEEIGHVMKELDGLNHKVEYIKKEEV